MPQLTKFYINGAWVEPATTATAEVINPANGRPIARIAMGGAADVDRAVAAARAAFETFSRTTRNERILLMRRIITELERRKGDLAAAMTSEMGAPAAMSLASQAQSGVDHFVATLRVLETFPFEDLQGTTLIAREPIGVCGLITPWNWPINQIACKVAPAIAAGCTMVLKPSEVAPLNALIFAEIMHDAGVPPGVFNLVNGDGPSVGAAMSAHPGIDMMSFTGSTRAGILVAKAAAETVKRVAQELGGKSANIVLDDADLEAAVSGGVTACFGNSGQSCDAPTRLLIPRARMAEAAAIAARTANGLKVGDPAAAGTDLGPVVSKVQYDKITGLIRAGIAEGARLVAGGPDMPEGLGAGYYIRPTVFADVTPDMVIARTEIFGPVIALIAYDSEDEAIRIANDTEYGLAAYVQSGDLARARRVASRLRAGRVEINYAPFDNFAPFGGYKQSGNGREYGEWGLHDFLEIKAVIGYVDPAA